MIELEMESDVFNELRAKYHHRSETETYVHAGLIAMGVKTSFELPTQYSVKYLPDFTWTNEFVDERSWRTYDRHLSAYIEEDGQCHDFGWIEAKPQTWLYVLRDECFRMANIHLRKVSERFKGAIVCRLDSGWLHARRNMHDIFKELAPPKLLAEKSGRNVLVIGAINAKETLSACLTPTAIVFERHHPLVNSAGWAAKLRRLDAVEEQKRAAEASRIEYERQEQERARLAKEQQIRREKELEILRPKVRIAIASQDSRWRMVNQRQQMCLSCGQMTNPGHGYLIRYDGSWHVMHRDCVDT